MRISGMAVLMVLAVSACQQSVKVEAAFDAKAAAFIKQEGEGRIDGHAFLKRHYGRATHAVGEWVYLIPSTPYTRERFAKLYEGRKFMPATGGRRIENTDPAFAEYTRKTKAESNGRFLFEKVAPGDYFVATTVTWKESEYAVLSKGGAVYETVTVTGREEKTIKVVVNGE